MIFVIVLLVVIVLLLLQIHRWQRASHSRIIEGLNIILRQGRQR